MLIAAGCGGTPKTVQTGPICSPASKFEVAYVLTGDTSDDFGKVAAYTVDSCTGQLSQSDPLDSDTGQQPADMAIDPLGRFAYVANLVSNSADLATISMYTIDATTGALKPTSPAIISTGFFPQGITIDPQGRFVYSANSDDNSVSMFTIDQSTGILTPTNPPSVATGLQPIEVAVDPSGKFAYAANQIDGTISMYSIDQATGVLTPSTPATVSAGGSPFSVSFDPSGKFAYAPDAYGNNEVWEYTVDPDTGVLTSTSDITVTAGESPVSVAIEPQGKFAYVVNRMDNTVSIFSIDASSGNLTQVGSAVATGEQPWRSTVDPSGKFLYVGNESGSVSVFSIASDGTLTSEDSHPALGSTFAVGVLAPK